jgi:hypothetical protein
LQDSPATAHVWMLDHHNITGERAAFDPKRRAALTDKIVDAAGGILNDGATLSVINCTVSANSSPGLGGAECEP